MKWLDDLKRDVALLSEQRRVYKANQYPVPPDELRAFNRDNIAAVTTFIRDYSEASKTPTMTQLVSVLAGEEGKTLDDHFKETFRKEWRDKVWRNLDKEGIENILKTLAAFAKAKGRDSEAVKHEYEIRSDFVAKARESETNQR